MPLLDHQTHERINLLIAKPLGIFLIYVAVSAVFAEDIEEHTHHAFGCFVSDGAGTVLLAEQGALISDGQNTFRTVFELEYSRGFAVVAGPLALHYDDETFQWRQPDRDWSYKWYFKGQPKLFSNHATDPDKLDVLLVTSEGGARQVPFTRSPNNRCQIP